MKEIAKTLREKGVNVFLDEGGLTGDTAMLKQLEDAILSSRVFICLETSLYRNKVNSEETSRDLNYCQLEFNFSAERNKPMVCVNTVGNSGVRLGDLLSNKFHRSFQEEIALNESSKIVEFLYDVYLKTYEGYRIEGPLVPMMKYHSLECYISRSQGKVHCRCGHVSSQYNLAEIGETAVPFRSLGQPDSWNAGIITRLLPKGDLPIQLFYGRLENYFKLYVSCFITLILSFILFVY